MYGHRNAFAAGALPWTPLGSSQRTPDSLAGFGGRFAAGDGKGREEKGKGRKGEEGRGIEGKGREGREGEGRGADGRGWGGPLRLRIPVAFITPVRP